MIGIKAWKLTYVFQLFREPNFYTRVGVYIESTLSLYSDIMQRENYIAQ